MERSKTYNLVPRNILNAASFLKEYYRVKGHTISHAENTQNGCHFFLMTKESLYRSIIGQVPVIIIEWAPVPDGTLVSVYAEMQHGISGDVTKIFEKLFNIPGVGISRKISNAITDPLFGKVFCDEALLISEGALGKF